MLILLRIVFGAALLYEMMEGVRSAPETGEAGDLTGAFYMAVCVGLGILNAVVWAPYLGDKVSGPLTTVMTGSAYVERTNWVLRFIRWLDARGYRRAVACFCFWEGVRHPSAPAAFVVGLKNARPGSWLEKVYAREVFRFNNTQNSVQAYLALKRHGIDPRPHPSQEVNIMLLSLERPSKPEATRLDVPAAPPPAALQRNPKIRLFKGQEAVVPAQEGSVSEAVSDPQANSGAPSSMSADVTLAAESGRQTAVRRTASDALARIAAFIGTP